MAIFGIYVRFLGCIINSNKFDVFFNNRFFVNEKTPKNPVTPPPLFTSPKTCGETGVMAMLDELFPTNCPGIQRDHFGWVVGWLVSPKAKRPGRNRDQIPLDPPINSDISGTF